MKEKAENPRKVYNTQIKLLGKSPQENKFFFTYLNINKITDNKKFWKSVKPLLSDKLIHEEVINLAKDGKMLDSSHEVAETFNIYFCNKANDIFKV